MALAEREVTQAAAIAARKIEAEMNIPYMIEELNSLPHQIRRMQEATQAARQAVDEARQDLELAEAVLVAQIGEEKDPRTGKAMFSNAEARKSELAKRKSSDEQYIQAAQRLAEAEEALSTAQFDLQLLEHRFASMRALARLTAGRLTLIGGDR